MFYSIADHDFWLCLSGVVNVGMRWCFLSLPQEMHVSVTVSVDVIVKQSETKSKNYLIFAMISWFQILSEVLHGFIFANLAEI